MTRLDAIAARLVTERDDIKADGWVRIEDWFADFDWLLARVERLENIAKRCEMALSDSGYANATNSAAKRRMDILRDLHAALADAAEGE